MKNFRHILIATTLTIQSIAGFGQVADPRSSSKSAAQYDAATINANIADSRDIMYFSRMGAERGSSADIKDLANEIMADFTGILYSMEQLSVAGAGASGNNTESVKGTFEEAANLNEALTSARGFNFDTTWAGGLLRLEQFKLAALTEHKEFVTDSRLKTAVTEAISPIKRHITRLSSLQKQLIRQDLQEKKAAEKARKEAEKAQKKSKKS